MQLCYQIEYCNKYCSNVLLFPHNIEHGEKPVHYITHGDMRVYYITVNATLHYCAHCTKPSLCSRRWNRRWTWWAGLGRPTPTRHPDPVLPVPLPAALPGGGQVDLRGLLPAALAAPSNANLAFLTGCRNTVLPGVTYLQPGQARSRSSTW